MKINVILLSFILGCQIVWGQTDQELAASTVEITDIAGHIYFLSDDLLAGREVGTNGNKIAASYLANSLRRFGVKPNPENGTYYQEVNLNRKSPPESLRLSLDGKEQTALALLESQPASYAGPAVYLGYGLEQDYTAKAVAGKFVITKAGSEEARDARSAYRLRAEKEALAKKNGALGIIELIQTEETMWGFIEHNFNTPQLSVPGDENPMETADFNYIWLRDTDGTLADTINSSVEVSLDSSGEGYDTLLTQNVVGIVEGSDPDLKDEYIIYSAHYDHVGIGKPDESGDSIYNGARDNAVGTTTVLSMAENLAKFPTKRSALFILFTAEEKGLLGSQYYVEHPVVPLNKVVFCFNSDNGGYNDTSLATIIGLTRTSAEDHIRQAVAAFGLTAIEDPAPEQGFFDRSDNVHFARKGVPAPSFSMGFNAFDEEITRYYHQPRDEADSLDYDYLLKFFRAYVLAGRFLGNSSETPFWNSGDKYESAGKSLYGKE